MDGVFMFKLFKTCVFCLLAAFLVWFGTVLADRQTLNENVIRFHVVADSDAAEDQAVKLKIRDAVVEYLQPVLAELPTAEEARAWLEAHLQEIKAVADWILAENGFAVYLPEGKQPSAVAGIYDSHMLAYELVS